MKNILITTSSFGKEDKKPLDFITSKANITLNPYGRQLSAEEVTRLMVRYYNATLSGIR